MNIKKPQVFIVLLLSSIFIFFSATCLMVFASDRMPLRFDYSKDKESVYFENRRINNSDPSTFVTLDYRYAKDNNQAYYLSHSGDPNVYKDKLLGELHGMLFPKFTLKIIEIADPDTFISLPYASGNAIWALDKNNVYWSGEIYERADAGSFEIINGPGLYARDKYQFYDSRGYWPTPLKEMPKHKTPSNHQMKADGK